MRCDWKTHQKHSSLLSHDWLSISVDCDCVTGVTPVRQICRSEVFCPCSIFAILSATAALWLSFKCGCDKFKLKTKSRVCKFAHPLFRRLSEFRHTHCAFSFQPMPAVERIPQRRHLLSLPTCRICRSRLFWFWWCSGGAFDVEATIFLNGGFFNCFKFAFESAIFGGLWGVAIEEK